MQMKKYFIVLLLMTVTFAVFSRQVDRPPDNNEVKIEITQQNDFIFPVVIDQPVLMVSETTYQTKEMPSILAYTDSKSDVQKGKATITHLKKSGTERYLKTIECFNIKSAKMNKVLEIPRIRSPVNGKKS